MPQVTFAIAGIAPVDVRRSTASERLAFWRAVVAHALKRKDWELAMGYNARGKKMPPVLPATRLDRRSEMTKSKRGDPYAPYLTPGRKLSRTRSLLTGAAYPDRAVFWWGWDSHTGDEWGKILEHHRKRGRQYDVIGLSPKGVAWVKAQATREWRARRAGKRATVTAPAPAAYVGVSNVLLQQSPAPRFPVRRPGLGLLAAALQLLLAAIAAGLGVAQIRKLLGDDFETVMEEAERRGWVVVKRTAGGEIASVSR